MEVMNKNTEILKQMDKDAAQIKKNRLILKQTRLNFQNNSSRDLNNMNNKKVQFQECEKKLKKNPSEESTLR